jgi:predicted CopG family antitoxin
MHGLDQVMTMLQSWSKGKFGNVIRELEKTRKNLEFLHVSNASSHEIRKVSDYMQELLYKEEMMWLQRSRVTWLKEGDRNTRFFHQKAVWRAHRNKIKKLKDSEGVWKDVPSDMERMATSYFQELFTRDPSLNSEELLALTHEKVTPAMNDDLCKDFTEEEISDALFQIGPLKAPGVDGFPARFYQRNWATIKVEVINAVKLFFRNRTYP